MSTNVGQTEDPRSVVEPEKELNQRDTSRSDESAGEATQADADQVEKYGAHSDLVSSIKALEQEAAQVNDLAELERAYAREVTSILKDFLQLVGKSYRLNPSMFPKLGSSVSDVVLTAQGIFFLTYRDGFSVARPAEDLSPESVVNVLERVLPDVRSLYVQRKQKLSERAYTLERVETELKKVSPRYSKKGGSP